MNKIEWNRVTWYSKLAALIIFVVLVPILTFYIGMRYEETKELLQAFPPSSS